MARPHETHEGMTRPGESGFTMVELLLVVVVLGILAAVVVANLGGVSSRATMSACQTDLKTVETAAGIYNTETGGTPVVTASLLTAGPTPYLQSWPSNPGYAITISGGVVYVQTAADSSPVRGTDPSACAGASTPAVATASASVVTLPVNGTDTSSAGANTATLEGNAVAASSGPLGAGSISFPGATGSYIRTTTQVTSPSTFSLSAWFDTTSSGPLVGFTSAQSAGATGDYDRMIWTDPSGHLVFGVWPYRLSEVTSPATYADGRWHSVVATWGPAGQDLYVDGSLVASTPASPVYTYAGYWHLGFAYTSSWSDAPTSDYFKGDLADVAVYPSQLSASQVASVSSATSYSAESQAVLALAPTSFWPLDAGA